MSVRAALPWLVLPLGSLGGSFTYDLNPAPLLVALMLGALLLASLGWTRGGLGAFLRLLSQGVLAGLMLWAALGFGLIVLFTLSPDNPTPFGRGAVAGLLPLLLLSLWLGQGFIRALSRSRAAPAGEGAAMSPAAPWLCIAGVVLFAFLPAVPVDCRGLKGDSFFRIPGGMSGSGDMSSWSRKPGMIPDRQEFPAGFRASLVSVHASRCFQDGAGRPRVSSLRASAPTLLVQLVEGESYQPARVIAAAFDPGTHRKRTPWRRVPSHVSTSGVRHMPYLNPLWDVSLYIPDLPGPLQAALR